MYCTLRSPDKSYVVFNVKINWNEVKLFMVWKPFLWLVHALCKLFLFPPRISNCCRLSVRIMKWISTRLATSRWHSVKKCRQHCFSTGKATNHNLNPWWRHQMETFSALLAFCAGNVPVTGEFPHKGQWCGALVFSLICALNKRLSKQSWGWWFGAPSRSIWRHCNAVLTHQNLYPNISAPMCEILSYQIWYN